MRAALTVIFAIGLVFILAACNTVRGNGNVTVETHDVSNFNRIDFSGRGQLFVSVAETESLTVSTDSNLQDVVEISVRNETLHIGTKNRTNIVDATELIYTVTVTDLEALEVSGSGEVLIDSVDSEDFVLNSSGSSTVTVETMDVESLDVDISGSGRFTVAGQAENLQIDISGSGRIHAFDLSTDNVDVDVSGSGRIEVTVSDELNGTISGSGQVTYRGEARVDVDISGSGSVNADN